MRAVRQLTARFDHTTERCAVHLFYLDESGTHPSSRHVVVGGIAVFERSAYWLQRELDEVVRRYFEEPDPSVQIHASPLRVPPGERARPPYDQLTGAQRREMLVDSYRVISESPHPVLFATVVEKEHIAPRDPYEAAFEDLISRFDRLLSRRHYLGDTQRGLVIVAESNYRERLETLGDRILRDGTQWSRTRNLADVPLFTRSARTRLLQAADLVVNAVYGEYEKSLGRDFKTLLPRFDREGDRLHGLTHLSADAATCMCIACYSWRTHRRTGIAEEPAEWGDDGEP